MGHVLNWDEARAERELLRQQGRDLVFTNGHFDLLHVGHLDYLEQAREWGGALFVGVNGDGATTQLKGSGRPLVPAVERARLLAALVPVTAAIIFEQDTARDLIEILRPDVYVKGGDYAHKPLPERAMVEEYGGRVVLIDLVPERSTTALIQRIQSLPRK
jgi:rfaE bifunctional protein nucleotidyltransferase chain/domain